MKRVYFFILFFLFGCAAVPESNIQKIEVKSPLILNPEKRARTVQLQKIIVGLNKGEVIGTRTVSLFGVCVNASELEWGGGVDISREGYFELFYNELKKAGYPVLGNLKEIFPSQNSPIPDLLVGAKIIEYKLDTCITRISSINQSFISNLYLKILWQFYSSVDQQIIHETTTEGGITNHEGTPAEAFNEAFLASIRNLIGKKEFFEFITTANGATTS